MNYDEAKIEATKIEEEENKISKVKEAIVHTNTILETTMKGNEPTITLSAEMYIDETDDFIINKSGKKIEKFRVRTYLNDGGGRTENPDYDLNRIFELDLPGYLQMMKDKEGFSKKETYDGIAVH